MDAQLKLTAAHWAEAVAAWDAVLAGWPNLSLAMKVKWWAIWRQLCGCRPREIIIRPADVGRLLGLDSKAGRECLQALAITEEQKDGLIYIKYEPADKRARRKGALDWKVWVPHPFDLQSGAFRAYVEQRGQLSFPFAGDDDRVDGDAAAGEGSPEAVSDDGDSFPATLPFKLGHDAQSSTTEPTTRTASPDEPPASGGESRPSVATPTPPPPAAKMPSSLPQVRGTLPPATSSVFSEEDPSSSLGLKQGTDPVIPTKTEDAASRAAGNFAAPLTPAAAAAAIEAARDQRLRDWLPDAIRDLIVRRQASPEQHAARLRYWKDRIVELVDADLRLDPKLLDRLGDAMVDRAHPSVVKAFFGKQRWAKTHKKFDPAAGSEFFFYFLRSAKNFIRECGGGQ